MLSTFSEEQVAYALRQVESGTAVATVCRQLGVSEATFFVREKKFAHLGVRALRRMRSLEEENTRLRQVVALDFTRPGTPTDNGHIEAFNGRLRDECLNVYQSLSLEHAKAVIEAWHKDYN